ncbi:MFS transporter [Hyphomonas sp.]|uniref:MFS transporter n=1 Tax=Hyphomonas sp. TaxID=87 RepID=UPI00391B1B71
MSEPESRRLSFPRVLAFASLSVPIAGVGLPLGVYLAPLYAQDVGLGLEMTGLLFMLLRFWDIVTDPVMGYLVDRYRTPLGRVRHWILLCVPVLGIATYFVYNPAPGASPWYFIGWMLVFYVGFTLLQTSRASWVPAIARDYDDRSRLFLWPEIVSVFSMLMLLAVPLILAGTGVEADRFGQVAVMGWVLIIALPVSAALSCLFVPDPPLRGESKQVEKFELKPLFAAIRHPMFSRVLGIELLVSTAISVTAANYLFVAIHAFGATGGQASLALVVFFITAILALPGWLWLAKRTEKRTAYSIAVLASGICFIAYIPLAPSGNYTIFLIASMMAGIPFSAPIFLARSMTADIVERVAAETGQNRAGNFYALLTSFNKVGSSLAFGVGYLIVGQVAGFRPGAENSDAAIFGLVLVFGLLPGLLYVAAGLLARTYPLTRAMQEETARSLERRIEITPGGEGG